MKWMASACKVFVSIVVFGLVGAGVFAWSAGPAQAATQSVLWAAPDGHGAACTSRNPCSLATAQAAVRKIEQGRNPAGVTVELRDGTYRLSR
jgi:hypothetical protein